MKTYDLLDAQGRVFAFEIDNALIGRRGVCRVVSSIPGAEVHRRPLFLSWFRESVFCEFEVQGHRFEVEEPFGDNSRYLVGASEPGWKPPFEQVHAAFRAARFPFLRKAG